LKKTAGLAGLAALDLLAAAVGETDKND